MIRIVVIHHETEYLLNIRSAVDRIESFPDEIESLEV